MSFVLLGHRGMGPTARVTKFNKDIPATNDDNFLPENTIESFQRSLDLGADGIEFDVQLTADGELAVIHIDQLINIAASQDMPLEEVDKDKLSHGFNMSSIRAYDIGNNGEVPTLREVLDYIVEQNPAHRIRTGNDMIINIELKSNGTTAPTYDLISEYISDGRLEKENFIFNSFVWDRLKNLRKLDADLKIMPAIKTVSLFGWENVSMPGWKVKEGAEYTEDGMEKLKAFHDEVGAYAFDCIIFDLRPEMIDFAEESGVGLFTSTSNENVNAGSIQGSLALMIDASARLAFTGFRADNVKETKQLIETIRFSKSLAQQKRIPEELAQYKDTNPQSPLIGDKKELAPHVAVNMQWKEVATRNLDIRTPAANEPKYETDAKAVSGNGKPAHDEI